MPALGSIFDPDPAAPSPRQAMLDEAAFAMWRVWSRAMDDEAGRARFARLRPIVMEGWIDEAKAAFRVFERYGNG